MNRREFFVKSAKAVIPITGAALLIANPAMAKVLEQAGDGSKLPQGTLPYSFNGFNERVQAYIVARYYVRLSTSFGHQGRETFKLATRIYAEQRGHRMAQRALADGQELTVATYHQYGEWVPTEESKQRGESLDQEVLWDRPYYAFKVKRCPWAIQFREMGLPEAGLAYCKDLDASIYRGFNPTIKYETRQTLHDHDCCIQCSPGTRITSQELSCPKKKSGLRSFEYHCAHSYWTFRQVLISVLGNKGKTLSEEVLEDVQRDLGQTFVETLQKYKDTDFNVA